MTRILSFKSTRALAITTIANNGSQSIGAATRLTSGSTIFQLAGSPARIPPFWCGSGFP